MNNSNKMSTKSLVLCAILTALVIILQLAGSFVRFGMFSVSLVLIPIVIGTATCGVSAGAWLGFVFGVAVLLSGDANLFLAVNVPGTIITVLLKGIACGYLSGITYRAFERFNTYVAVAAAAVVCPLANTGVFLLGCIAFFMEKITEMAGPGANVAQFMIVSLVGFNFLFELGFNIILSPVIVRLLNIRKKQK